MRDRSGIDKYDKQSRVNDFVERTLNENLSVQNKLNQQREKILQRFKPSVDTDSSKMRINLNS